MNSVLAAYNDSTQARTNYIRGLFHNPVNDGKIILLVEGTDDSAFYRQYMDDSVVTFGVTDGHKWTRIILENLNGGYHDRLAAVNDADFCRLDGFPQGLPDNLFFTDCHDWEMSVISEDRTRILAARYKLRSSTEENLHSKIIDGLNNYSYVRWVNEQNPDISTKLAFKDNTHEYAGLTIKECVGKLNSSQDSPQRRLDPEYAATFHAAHKGADWKQLHNGHDYFRLLHNQFLHNKESKRQLKKGEAQREYIKLYTIAEFRSTDLAKNLEAYFSPLILLRR